MKDTVKMLVESACVPDLDFATRNTAAFNILDPITESQKMNTTYIPQKVIVVKDPENQGGYLVEFSNNLERLMQDQDVGVIEAMQEGLKLAARRKYGHDLLIECKLDKKTGKLIKYNKIQRPDRQVSCKVCGIVVTVNILPWFCFIEKFKYNKFNVLILIRKLYEKL